MSEIKKDKFLNETINNLRDSELGYNYYNIRVAYADIAKKTEGASGDMCKNDYDSDDDGKVEQADYADNAGKLDNHSLSDFMLKNDYDNDNDGKVDNANHADNADKLENHAAIDFGINSIVTAGSDLNSIVRSGFYRLENNLQNAPAGVDWGQLIVSKGSAGDTVLQIASDYNSGNIYWRSGAPPEAGGGGSWGAWKKFGENYGLVASSIQGNGYIKFYNGLIIQWGASFVQGNSVVQVNFPISFPNNLFSVVSTPVKFMSNVDSSGWFIDSYSLSWFKQANTRNINCYFGWIAFGN